MKIKLLTAVVITILPMITLAQDRRYASRTTADEAFVANPKESASVIRWVTVPDPDAECRALQGDFSRDSSRGKIRACAKWTSKTCTIITGAETSHALLGHELRHCFEGKFHD